MKLVEKKAEISAEALLSAGHALVLFDPRLPLSALPLQSAGAAAPKRRQGVAPSSGSDIGHALAQLLKRKGKPESDLAKTPQALDVGGSRLVFLAVDAEAATFERHTLIRKALALVLEETPEKLVVAALGGAAWRERIGADAAYVAAVNAEALPSRKRGPAAPALKQLVLYGSTARAGLDHALAAAEGNRLTRSLAALPPNELSPGSYRKRIKALAKTYGWKVSEHDFAALKKMGAGAFCAVAQGSPAQDAAIVRV